jgi:hypothetical protein
MNMMDLLIFSLSTSIIEAFAIWLGDAIPLHFVMLVIHKL